MIIEQVEIFGTLSDLAQMEQNISSVRVYIYVTFCRNLKPLIFLVPHFPWWNSIQLKVCIARCRKWPTLGTKIKIKKGPRGVQELFIYSEITTLSYLRIIRKAKEVQNYLQNSDKLSCNWNINNQN